MSQPTIERILRLMLLLPNNHCLSVKQIAQRRETDNIFDPLYGGHLFQSAQAGFCATQRQQRNRQTVGTRLHPNF